MSVRCITQVLENSQHSGTELLVLLVLANYSDDEGSSFPSVTTLAQKCRMKRRNAQYILSMLQDSGELRILKNAGPNGCNRYRILPSAQGTKAPAQSAAPVQPIAQVQSSAPMQCNVVGGAMECAKPVQPIAPKPSLNRQGTVNGPFERFWLAYPKKVGKPAAHKAFRSAKINGHLVDVLADIEDKAKSESWTKSGGQFIPNPATYLNQRRWEDEKTPASTQIPGLI